MDLPPSNIEVVYEVHSKTNIFQLLHVDLKGWSIAIRDTVASIIKIPPKETTTASDTTFAQLPCSEEDAQKITKLITTLGEKGYFALWHKYQKELRQIGRDIDHVHPLKFLSVILTNPYSKSCLIKVFSDHFKKSNFMDGLGNGLTSQNQQGKISIYLNDFAAVVGVPPESLQKYVEKQDWENMVVFLMNN